MFIFNNNNKNFNNEKISHGALGEKILDIS